MSDFTRRSFLRSTSAAAVVGSLGIPSLYAIGRSARPSIGIIGCGSRAQGLLGKFGPVAEIAWVCDPDRQRLQALQQRSEAKRATSDLREVLDDKSVHAVVIATPDHWHAPAAILACDAGKHVYVEKPCSHNFREGRLLVDAARRNNVVVQHGTDRRTLPLIANAVQMLREGAIGEVLMAKAWNIQRRRNIGHEKPTNAPESVDYDMWVGPAEFVPYQSNRFHYNWHWWHNFGTGDIGNDGAHEMDMARWGIGVDGLPSSAAALGGKYYFDDDQQFPDTATCVFEWPGDGSVGRRRQLIFEMRIWSKNYPYNCDSGVEFYGTKGMLFVSKRGKMEMWNESNQPVQDPQPEAPPVLAPNHAVDFLRAIEQGTKPAADIMAGHDSVALIHLANIAVRTGRSLTLDPAKEAIVEDEEAHAMLARTYREGGHWAMPSGL